MVGGRLIKRTKQQQGLITSVARNVVRNVKAAPRREKQQRAIEEPKLDNARKLRGIFSIDPKHWLAQGSSQMVACPLVVNGVELVSSRF